MNKIEIIGKNKLGEVGFCFNVDKMGDMNQFHSRLEVIKEEVLEGKTLVSTSITNVKLMSEDGTYSPIVREITPEIIKEFTPEVIYDGCLKGIDTIRPQADVLIVKGSMKDKVSIMTFSKSAPVFIVENDEGDFGIGVVLRKALQQKGKELLINIKNMLGGTNPHLKLITTTNYCYQNMGTIPEFMEQLAKAEGFSFDWTGYDTAGSQGIEEQLYKNDEKGNHVVLIENR